MLDSAVCSPEINFLCNKYNDVQYTVVQSRQKVKGVYPMPREPKIEAKDQQQRVRFFRRRSTPARVVWWCNNRVSDLQSRDRGFDSQSIHYQDGRQVNDLGTCI